MNGERDRGSRWPAVAGILGALVLVFAGLWLLTHCSWFWVAVNGMMQSLASRSS
jgi:hypothetical protein